MCVDNNSYIAQTPSSTAKAKITEKAEQTLSDPGYGESETTE